VGRAAFLGEVVQVVRIVRGALKNKKIGRGGMMRSLVDKPLSALPSRPGHIQGRSIAINTKKSHIPSDLGVDRCASYVEGSSILDFLLLHTM
jgi:hypothetical protein